MHVGRKIQMEFHGAFTRKRFQFSDALCHMSHGCAVLYYVINQQTAKLGPIFPIVESQQAVWDFGMEGFSNSGLGVRTQNRLIKIQSVEIVARGWWWWFVSMKLQKE